MNRRNRRSGFTLVELLAVIVIIGILVSLVSVAVMNARVTAQKAAITAEINQLDMAMSRLASESGEAFPPDFTLLGMDPDAYMNGEVKRYMARRFPRYRSRYGNLNDDIDHFYNADPQNAWRAVAQPQFFYHPKGSGKINMDAAEALVFWLGGLSIPQNAHSSKLAPFSANVSNPVEGSQQSKRITALYEFQQERLVDRDNDGWYEYVPQGNIGAGNGPPYVYFSSKSYANLIDNNGNLDANKAKWVRYPSLGASQSSEWGFATPYRSSENVKGWVNPKKFQILSAGLDANYGNTVAATQGPKGFPGGDKYETADLDNLSNFAESDMEKKKP